MKRSDDRLANMIKQYAKRAYNEGDGFDALSDDDIANSTAENEPVTHDIEDDGPDGPDVAESFLVDLLMDVTDLIKEKVDAFMEEEQFNGEALQQLVEFNTNSSNEPSPDVMAISQLVYEAMMSTAKEPREEDDMPEEIGESVDTSLVRDLGSMSMAAAISHLEKLIDQGKIKKLDALRMMKETTFSRLT